MTDEKKVPNYVRFLLASTSGVGAAIASYPFELLKTRMQVSGEGQLTKSQSSFGVAKEIVRQQGVLGLYNGLSASMLRQATYTGVRLGAFQMFVEYATVDGKPPSFAIKCLCGAVSGVMGAIAGLPADISLTRMAADGRLPVEKRRNYTNVFNAISRMVKEEGPSVLFRGAGPTIIRAIIVNVSQVVSYTQAKETLIKNGLVEDNIYCHFMCSIFSALVTTSCALPADIAKVRIQNMKIINGKPEYKGMLDAWMKIVSKEGFLSLWKGFTPLFLRNGPNFIVLFILNEKLTYYYRKLVLKDSKVL